MNNFMEKHQPLNFLPVMQHKCISPDIQQVPYVHINRAMKELCTDCFPEFSIMIYSEILALFKSGVY